MEEDKGGKMKKKKTIKKNVNAFINQQVVNVEKFSKHLFMLRLVFVNEVES